MKIKNEKQVLQVFCNTDNPLHPEFARPFLNEKYNEVWACDGHYLLMVDPKLLRRKYKSSDVGKSIVIPMQNVNTIVDVGDIEAACNSFGMEPEMLPKEGSAGECPACSGDGEVQWEYMDPSGHTHYMDYECPVCDGTGYVKEEELVPTGRMLPPDGAGIRIDTSEFLVCLMLKVLEGLKLLGCKQLRHTVDYCNAVNLFEVQPGIRLLMMPAVLNSDSVVVKTTKVE